MGNGMVILHALMHTYTLQSKHAHMTRATASVVNSPEAPATHYLRKRGIEIVLHTIEHTKEQLLL